ncbi:MAG: hypothetical protein F4X56_00155 [Gammaproteobacteria bacterium]|nr:hypothetical protein [Gammaproteobacteria bacterium]MYC24310.1 hypothetical protein [Gammaproteobacteria bacterium]
MKLGHLSMYSVLLMCGTLAVYPAEDISYNYWDVGISLSDQDSEYLSGDLNFFGDINVAKNLHRNSSQDNQFGVHFWVDFTQSRNLSDDSAYTLALVQTVVGLGLHYSKETFSIYLRLGGGNSSAEFKTTSSRSSSPSVTGGGSGDIFAPPLSIFDSNRPQTRTTHTNDENGSVGKIGIRYSLFENYEIGAALRWAKMNSLGSEFSTYVQRDFESPLFSGNTTLSPRGRGVMSLKFEATTGDRKSSIGLSLVFSY